jgi:hypothetical protein
MAATSKRPFWMHQLVEYILGGALIASGLQSPTPLVPAVVGGLVMLHAALTIGPLGAFRVIGRRTHRVIDVVIISIEFLAVVQPWIALDNGTRIIIAGIASVHLFVWWNTNFAERPKSQPMTGEGGRSAEVGRFAGRLVGNGVNAVRRPRTEDDR